MTNNDVRYMCKEEKVATLLALRLELFRDNADAMPFDDSFVQMARVCAAKAGIEEEQIDGVILAAIDLFLELRSVSTDHLIELYTHWITSDSLPKTLGHYVTRAIRDELHARH